MRHRRGATIRRAVLATVTLMCGGAFLFFAIVGLRLVWFAATYRGEGSLGHVGVYIGALLFPLLALFFGGATWLAWGAWRRPASPPRSPQRPDGSAAA